MAVNDKPGIITRAEQKQHTRQKLIEATMAVIASEGFSGVTMAKVAEKAGLSRGIGNFHWIYSRRCRKGLFCLSGKFFS